MVRVYTVLVFIFLVLIAVKPTHTAVASTNTVTPENVSNIVVAAYQQELGRAPDAGGMATFKRYLLEGRSVAWLHDVLRKSDEAVLYKKYQKQHRFNTRVLPPVCLLLGLLWCLLFHYFSRWRREISLAFVGACLLLFGWLVWSYTINIPFRDDFDAILGYGIQPWHIRWHNLLAQHNEHRLATLRLLTELSMLFSGTINFKFIAITGDLMLVGIMLLLARRLKQYPVYLPLVAGLSLAPFSWVNLVWAMASVQNFGVHFFVLLSLILFFGARNFRWRMVTGSLAAMAAVYTSGSGIIVFPALLAVLVASIIPGRKYGSRGDSHSVSWREVAVICVVFLLVAAFYFHGYEKPSDNPSLGSVLLTPVVAGQYFLLFMGAFTVSAGASQVVASLVGLALVALFVWLTYKRAYLEYPATYCFALYLLLTAGAAVLTRLGFGVSQAATDRYRINSLLFMVCMLVLAVQMYPRFFARRAVCAILFAVALLLQIYTWQRELKQFRRQRNYLICETAGWLEHRHGLAYPRENMAVAGATFDAAIAKGLYHVPPLE